MDTERAPEALIADHGWQPKRQTAQNIHRSLLPIEELWRWKEQFSRPVLSFNPFPEGASAKAVQVGTEANRHPTVPPAIAFPYLRGALLMGDRVRTGDSRGESERMERGAGPGTPGRSRIEHRANGEEAGAEYETDDSGRA